jgi:putative DNA primase/helicase
MIAQIRTNNFCNFGTTETTRPCRGSGADIAHRLGDARREGLTWRCRCPLHGGRSLILRDGDGGRVLATCWGGCDRLDVLAELRRRGLLDGRADYAPGIFSAQRRDDDARRTARALNIWRNTEHGASTIAGPYLARRRILPDQWPPNLRFQPRCPRPRDDAGNIVAPLPAMVALVEHVERGPVAVHCTYLQPDGSGKANIEKPKAIFGPVGGGAVRLGVPRTGEWLAVGEGIETALSVAVACSMPAWAALSAGGIKNLILPPEATHVLVCADHDASGVGQRAAREAAHRWLHQGRHVKIALPLEPDTDFNNVLNSDSPDHVEKGVRHVA